MRKGSVLVFILWVLVVMAVFSVAVSFRASTDIRLARYETGKIKAGYMARAGVMKMLAGIAGDPSSYRSLNQDWNRDRDNAKVLSIRDSKIFYGASDESARLNLNSSSLNKAQLAALGIEEVLAEEIVKYRARKGDKDFEFPEELFLVNGMTRQIYSGIEDFVTIYRGKDPVVNINTAAARVLMAVILDQGLVLDILEYRRGPDGKEGTLDDGVFRHGGDISVINGVDPGLFSVSSNVFRIWAQAFIAEDKDSVINIEAVIDRSGKIYNWKEF